MKSLDCVLLSMYITFLVFAAELTQDLDISDSCSKSFCIVTAIVLVAPTAQVLDSTVQGGRSLLF